MKKLLYITANPKPEEESSCRKVSSIFVDEFLKRHLEYDLVELDLYKTHIPVITHKIFPMRNTPADIHSSDLSKSEKENLKIINQLASQFLECDIYVIAAPMWNLFFPSILKTYIDCIVQCEKLIKVTPSEIRGLLDDIDRKMIYIQSSGGKFSNLFTSKLNYGVHYLHDLFKYLGVKKFETLLIENTGFTPEEELCAIEKAINSIPKIIDKF